MITVSIAEINTITRSLYRRMPGAPISSSDDCRDVMDNDHWVFCAAIAEAIVLARARGNPEPRSESR
jgi:hypothetical protein